MCSRGQGFTARHQGLGTDPTDSTLGHQTFEGLHDHHYQASLSSFTITPTPFASPYCKDEVADTIRTTAVGAMHLRMLSNTHIQLGRPGLDLPLLVQLPPSRKHPLPLPHRQASGYPRLPDHPHASRRYGLQSSQLIPWLRLQRQVPRLGSLRCHGKWYRSRLQRLRSHGRELHSPFDG